MQHQSLSGRKPFMSIHSCRSANVKLCNTEYGNVHSACSSLLCTDQLYMSITLHSSCPSRPWSVHMASVFTRTLALSRCWAWSCHSISMSRRRNLAYSDEKPMWSV